MEKYWVCILGILGGVGCGAVMSNPRPAICSHISSPFGGGSGTSQDPYTICTVSHLLQVQNYLSSSFKQYSDLDLAENTSFSPIGSATTPFTGSYDGNGKKISNWSYGDATLSNVGFFRVVSGSASISNLNLVNFTLTGAAKVGSLVGSSDTSSVAVQISQCTSSGTVTSNTVSGGLVGALQSGTIVSSSSSATVKSDAAYAGGLVGTISSSTVTNSSATGNVSADLKAGGLVSQSSLSSRVINSYATGNVAVSSGFAGGLVFGIYSGSSITDSYATGKVSTTSGGNVAGLVDFINDSSVSRSYSTGEVVSVGAPAGGLIARIDSGSVSMSYSKSNLTSSSAGTGGGGLIGVANAGAGTTISNSYASGVVNLPAWNRVGGLVGAAGGSNTTIVNSFSTSSVTGSSQTGGLLGFCSSCGPSTSSYWDTQTSGKSSSAGSETGKTTSEMQTQSTYAGWDFTSVWNSPSPGNYPTLR